jgi:hypothetical protein
LGGRLCPLLRLAEAAALIPAAENSPEARGAGALRVLGATWTAGEVGEGAGSLPVGTRSGRGHRRGGGPRRSGSAVALRDSGEQLNATGGNRKDGRGRERFLTSRRTPGTPRWRRRRGGSPSRRWRTSAAAQRTAVSAGRVIRGGGGKLERVPGCGRWGGAHRGRGHGGAPTATEKQARAAAV